MDLPIALQLYTVRDETARDFPGTLRQVAALGYPAVEFAGYGGLSGGEMASLLRDTGLQAAATHVAVAALDADLEGQIDYCLAIGCQYLVVPGLRPEEREDVQGLAERLNRFGQRCRERGLTLGYHNHDWEFAERDGGRFIDLLLDNTEAELVVLELDAYWAAYAGVDPIDYLRRRSGRVALIHLKDMTADREFAEVGDGTLDIPAISGAAREAGARWFIVENDAPRIPSLESARRSLENLQAMQPA